jgi:hypothetical protein
MNLYTCAIDIRNGTKALAFAKAVGDWMDYLQAEGTILRWRLLRRKLNLASSVHRDFLLEIEVQDLAQLDRAFRMLGRKDETVERLYFAVHEQIEGADTGLFRPFPDPERAERMALI